MLQACALAHVADLAGPSPDQGLLDFKLGPILSTGDRPPRLYVAWDGERSAWLRRVRDRFPGPQVDRFLASVPSACRRMVDTSGPGWAELYLDDLHLHGHPEMCRVLSWPDGQGARIVVTETPPAQAAALLAPFLALGGMLAEREGQDRAVWVSEAKWTGSAGQALDVLMQQGAPPQHLEALVRAMEPFGLRPYVDAVDAYDGALDVTFGFVAT
jgi:hypothetical protein